MAILERTSFTIGNIHTMESAIQQTQCWVKNVIIAHNICPFAKRVFDNDSIHYQLMSADLRQSLDELLQEFQRLDENSEIATTLVIHPKGLESFDDYLDYHAIATQLLIDNGYEGIYQLATFHPDYCFEGSNADDPANYTNRSPHPMFHIIREDSLEKALQKYPNPEKIPERNIRYTRDLGLKTMKKHLDDCVNLKQ